MGVGRMAWNKINQPLTRRRFTAAMVKAKTTGVTLKVCVYAGGGELLHEQDVGVGPSDRRAQIP